MNLQSIAVNGQVLPIDPSIFASSISMGTIVDSGTTLAYLVAEAFDPFVQAVSILFSAWVAIGKKPSIVGFMFPSFRL